MRDNISGECFATNTGVIDPIISADGAIVPVRGVEMTIVVAGIGVVLVGVFKLT